MLHSSTAPAARSAAVRREINSSKCHMPICMPLIRSTTAIQRRSSIRSFGAARRTKLVRATTGAPEVSTDPASTSEEVVLRAVQVLRTAGDGRSAVQKPDIFQALKTLEKSRLKGGEDWYAILGGDKSPGRRWRLVYTTSKAEVAKDRKGEKGSKGMFFPLVAAQRYDREAKQLENGVFLGHVASLVFVGPQSWRPKNKLVFNFWNLKIKVGPWKFGFDIKKGDKDAAFDPEDRALPFFTYFYVDENICCARGRGGGWAFWARTDPKWDLEHGIV